MALQDPPVQECDLLADALEVGLEERLLKRNAIHHRTHQSLERLGWCEFKDRDAYLLARLTKAGREIRDRVYIKRARRRAREQGHAHRWPKDERPFERLEALQKDLRDE